MGFVSFVRWVLEKPTTSVVRQKKLMESFSTGGFRPTTFENLPTPVPATVSDLLTQGIPLSFFIVYVHTHSRTHAHPQNPWTLNCLLVAVIYYVIHSRYAHTTKRTFLHTSSGKDTRQPYVKFFYLNLKSHR